MPTNERAYKYQDAVLWSFSSWDSYGQPVVNPTPTQIKCRWDDTRKENVAPNTASQSIDAQLITMQLIPIGSIMKLGTISQLPASGQPIPDLMECISSSAKADIKNRIYEYTAQLMRLKTTTINAG